MTNKYQRQAKREARLFKQGKMSFCNSAENLEALGELVKARWDNIARALKAFNLKAKEDKQ